MKFIKSTDDSITNYFPEGKTPFPHQKKALLKIEEAIRNGTKFILVHAPTGSGKSYIASTLSNASNDIPLQYRNTIFDYSVYRDEDVFDSVSNMGRESGSYILTTTKSLQDQYEEEFKNIGSVLKGKSNYQCEVDDQYSADLAPCSMSKKLLNDCMDCDRCPYYKAANNTFTTKMAILNYSKYLNLKSHLKNKEILICDECSELETEIVNYYAISISYKKLKMCGINIEQLETEKPQKVKVWLVDLLKQIRNRIESLQPKFGLNGPNDTLVMAKVRVLNEYLRSIDRMLDTWESCEYIIEIQDNDGDCEVSITPFTIDNLTKDLFSKVKYVVMMSATIVDHKKEMEALGIKEYAYIDVESSFDPNKSPIYCLPHYPLSYKTKKQNLPKILDYVEKIVEHHSGEKGIIHTHSFDITQAIKNRLFGKRFLYREEGTKNEEIVIQHSIRKDDTVLISPSLTMGLDLKGDLGKWQIIIKLPYPSLANKRIKKFFNEYPNWYQRQMLKQLVQASGRCTRSKLDESVTYILDGNIIYTLQNNKRNLPSHFLDRFCGLLE